MKNFIIFEGPDFSGKTTIINKLNDEFLSKRFFYDTREPGSYLIPSMLECEKYREMLLRNSYTPLEQAVIFSKSRYIHTLDIVKYLNIKNVICDRYIVSSLAYQGYAQELGKDTIYELNKCSLDLLKDNNIKMHIFKFNISKDEWLKRKNKRLKKTKLDEIENKNLDDKIMDFFDTKYIYEYYTDSLNAIHYDINADLPIDKLYKNIVNIIKKM